MTTLEPVNRVIQRFSNEDIFLDQDPQKKEQAAAKTTSTKFIASGHSHYIWGYWTIHMTFNVAAVNVIPVAVLTTSDVSANATTVKTNEMQQTVTQQKHQTV